MLQTLKLLLPALIPSWRFFDVIAASPRIEFTLLDSAEDTAATWQEFRPRPAHLPLRDMLKRMAWNPSWNESLYLVSCAERLVTNASEHSQQEILNRIRRDIAPAATKPFLQFRLQLLHRNGAVMEQDVAYTSPVYSVQGAAQ
ncbi:MAG: hypothetical protein PW788_14185 [Micavibrio sp.]|nr:hypothetical protein [Micavibrio sp.]